MTEKKNEEKAAAPKAARPKKAAKDVDALVAEVAVAAKAKPAKPAKAAEAKAEKPKTQEAKTETPGAAKTIRIRQVGSGICTPVDHKQTLKALGLRGIRQEVVRPDTPTTRGMVRKVRHLVTVVGE